jgi:hypothetical protein
MDAPEARGADRIRWPDLPADVRGEVERRWGRSVAAWTSATQGFSPGMAGVLTAPDEERLFVKAVAHASDPLAPRFHRREARVVEHLPPGIAPALRWWFDDGAWVVLAFEAVEGHHPSLPWRPDELDRVLAATGRLAATPAPPGLRPAGDRLALMFGGWSALRQRPDDLARSPAGVRERIDALAALEGDPVRAAAAGSAICHIDLRGDNVLLAGDGHVWIVDWPHAVAGAPWIDLVFLLPTVEMQGGPPAHALFAAQPQAAGAEPGHLRTIVAGWAGALLANGFLPDPPAIPNLRAFQRAQVPPLLRWLEALEHRA